MLSPSNRSAVQLPANSAHEDGRGGVIALPPTAAQPVPAATPSAPPRCHACNACLGVCAVLLFVLSALFAGVMTFHTFRRVEYVGRLLRDVVNETRRLDTDVAAAAVDASSSPLPAPTAELGPTRAAADHEGVVIDNGTSAYLGRLRQ
nr:uncharacterized protein LOC119169418 [Rhipicephalus microplus]